ncbi:MAG: GGDEF domain-containing protein [Acidobacteriota bacterium]|nr:GGDEF domain-containing protein [Acidobacteriota bacterium]
MSDAALYNIALMMLEAFLVGTLLVVLFRLRSRFGLSPLYIAIGSFQYLQIVLAISIYVEFAPGILIGPGFVLFMSAPFAILLVYIREDIAETSSLILGLVFANAALGLLSTLFAYHLDGSLARNFLSLPTALFRLNVRVMLAGTGALILDAVLVIIIFETLARVFRRKLLLPAMGSLVAVAGFDSLVFVTGGFLGSPEYLHLLQSNLMGKTGLAAFFSIILVIYLRYFDERTEAGPRRDVFEILSYRQKYEELKGEVIRDPLTGLYNRRFFDEQLPLALAMAQRADHRVTLMIIDLDGLKEINDRYGHPDGDRAIATVGEVVGEIVRTSDIPCRVGGDEFAVILPGTSRDVAGRVHGRVVDRLRERSEELDETPRWWPSVSGGWAAYPAEASSPEELYRLADERMYEGKAQGRARS